MTNYVGAWTPTVHYTFSAPAAALQLPAMAATAADRWHVHAEWAHALEHEAKDWAMETAFLLLW